MIDSLGDLLRHENGETLQQSNESMNDSMDLAYTVFELVEVEHPDINELQKI